MYDPQANMMTTQQRRDPAHSQLEMLKMTLHRHPLFLRRQLTLGLKNQVITISGQVASYYEKQMAQEAMRNLLGNTLINNDVCVVPE